MNRLTPGLVIGLAAYAIVLLAGTLGIIGLAPDEQIGGLMTGWYAVAGIGGLAGVMAAGKNTETAGHAETAARNTERILNGEMERKIEAISTRVIGKALAEFAAQQDAKASTTRPRKAS